MSKTILVSGTTVYIDGEENDKTIVMIHGWPDTHVIWKNQVNFFKNKFKCVTFTLPGFLKDDNKQYTLDDIIQRIDFIVKEVNPDKKIILMLHDWGCVFGYEYATRNTEKIERIVAIDIGDTASEEFKNSLSASAKLMLFTYQITLALAWKMRNSIGTSLTKALAKGMKARSNFDNIHAGMDIPYAMRWLGVSGGLKALQPIVPSYPFYYAYGLKKPFLFQSESWIKNLEKSPLNKVQAFNSSHWVMIDKADEFNESVNEWLLK